MSRNRFGIDVDPTASGGSAAAVTPSDSTTLAMTRALYVGSGGDLAVQLWDDSSSVTLVAVPTGSVLPLRVRKVLATNTTASSIVAIF